ncbi:MAG: hypothetical protein ACC645_02890 [Pirellulales bacterium]
MLQRLLMAAAGSLMLALVCPAVVAEELSEEDLKKIAAIDYRGIGFSSRSEDLLQTIPSAELNATHVGSDKGISTYEVRDDSANDCVLLRFFDGALVEIDFIYFANRVASEGGADAITSRAVKKFGPPAMKIDKTRLWDFPTIDRRVIGSYENKKWSLHVYHRSRRLAIRGYKDTSVDPESWMQVTVGPAVPRKSKTTDSVPGVVIRGIQGKAERDHPDSRTTQDYVVGNQIRARQELNNVDCPQGMPSRVFRSMKGRIASDYPADYSTQIRVLKRQLSAYAEIPNVDCPRDMSLRVFKSLKDRIARDHPTDYSTQIFVLKRQLFAYAEIANMSTPFNMAGSHFFSFNENFARPNPSAESNTGKHLPYGHSRIRPIR